MFEGLHAHRQCSHIRRGHYVDPVEDCCGTGTLAWRAHHVQQVTEPATQSTADGSGESQNVNDVPARKVMHMLQSTRR